MNEEKGAPLVRFARNVPHYDGKAWTASIALGILSLAITYIGYSFLEWGLVQIVIALGATILPLALFYNWYAKRRGWSTLWSFDVLMNLLPLPFDF